MAREKRVFNDYRDVARLWANQSQDYAEYRGQKMYFEGNTIYSYGSHFQIAKHVTNDAGESAVLFTLDTYSNTTRDQCAVVRGAVGSRNIIFCKTPKCGHEENIAYFLSEIEEATHSIQKKANRKFEQRVQVLKTAAARLKKYATFFNISLPLDIEIKLAFIEGGDVVNKLRNGN